MIRQKHTITITDTSTLTLAQRGAVILDKGTAFTVTVVATATLFGNLWYEFINIGAGTVTVVEDGGGALATLQQDESATIINNGTEWSTGGVKVHVLGDITGNIVLENTVDSATGVIFKEESRFMHNFGAAGSDNFNTFLGENAGNFTMAIAGETFHASYNTGIGAGVMDMLTTGYYNSGFGESSLANVTAGSHNSGGGRQSLYNTTTGVRNTGFGSWSIRYNQAGNHNTALGYKAGFGVSASDYSNNIFVGYQAGDSITTGSGNIIIGYDQDMPTGATSNHLNIGGLIYGNIGSSQVGINVVNPSQALDIAGSIELEETTTSTTGVVYKGVNRFIHNYTATGANGLNLFVGVDAGNFTMAISGQAYHASNNTGIGYQTLYNITEGYNNSAIGHKVLYNTTTGFENMGFGQDSLYSLTTGSLNTAIGTQSLYNSVGAVRNTGIGYQTLYYNQGGNSNVAMGYRAGFGVGISTHSNNTFIGYQAGDSVTTGSGNIIIGYDEDMSAGDASDELRIGGTIFGDLNAETIGIGVIPTEKLQVSGNIFLTTDSQKMLFGTGKDMSIYYDGTDGYIKSDEVAPSDLHVTTGAAKTVVLDTPVYQDINVGGMILLKPAASAPDIDTFVDKNGADTTIPTYAFAVDEYLSGGFELDHSYKEGTNLSFHVHWQGIDAPSTGTDNVQWRLAYTVGRKDTVLEPAVVIDSPDTVFDVQYECKRTDFAAIDGSGFLFEDQFTFSLYRVASTGDAYAGDALIQTNGIHCQQDTMGSRTVDTK